MFGLCGGESKQSATEIKLKLVTALSMGKGRIRDGTARAKATGERGVFSGRKGLRKRRGKGTRVISFSRWLFSAKVENYTSNIQAQHSKLILVLFEAPSSQVWQPWEPDQGNVGLGGSGMTMAQQGHFGRATMVQFNRGVAHPAPLPLRFAVHPGDRATAMTPALDIAIQCNTRRTNPELSCRQTTQSFRKSG